MNSVKSKINNLIQKSLIRKNHKQFNSSQLLKIKDNRMEPVFQNRISAMNNKKIKLLKNYVHNSDKMLQQKKVTDTQNLSWDGKGKYKSKGSTNAANVTGPLKKLIKDGVITDTNDYINGHLMAASFGGSNSRGNIMVWYDTKEAEWTNYELTVKGEKSVSPITTSPKANDTGTITVTADVEDGTRLTPLVTAFWNNVSTEVQDKNNWKDGSDNVYPESDLPVSHKLVIENAVKDQLKGILEPPLEYIPTYAKMEFENKDASRKVEGDTWKMSPNFANPQISSKANCLKYVKAKINIKQVKHGPKNKKKTAYGLKLP